MTPPTPLRLAGRPTQGGLVVPWISVHHADGRATLGAVHGSRVDTCLRGRRCQTCGEHLGDRLVVLVRPQDMTDRYTAEPAMHPECAAYSIAACPMTNGQMDHYRPTPRHLAGRSCDIPGCDCAGWVAAEDATARRNAPAEPYYAVWLRLTDYRLATDRTGKLLGIALAIRPLKMRRVGSGEPTPEQAALALLLDMPGDGAS
ncbi:hypothetical protein DP939_02225 [Spongiactinospora rosea]|uniref:Uncharacterized protein n=1 Tax=Spongiactinospora rosea TaxID=2248750 RepID=A0A366M667_9ACTN|nr:hypothetical protein [Spongiactinospora rosea]RBQ21547.1 hypothetical protein DP939_02225 [Spongiactinospora rosea]